MADAKIRTKVKKNSKDRYWTATLQPDYVNIGQALTFSQAVKEVQKNRNVFTVTQHEAKKVARVAGGNVGANNKDLKYEIHKKKVGYYYHYHTYNRKGGHVYFLFFD